ncbi:PucR family transcriptional regulator ligand-binding domain-containing protein [Streptomyces tibetensis]|uniref:PucR family transcriptional regulator ligand-binding domain-containing protein n=1 Tax=Streptomyces tibetensis TaxID=2382123 RepID=UPI00380F00BF
MPEPAVPPTPPTPPVPLTALLAREDLGLRQLAGPSAEGVVVHWVHTSEMADPYPYLLGGELLLSAGVHIPEAADPGTSYFDDYVSRIVAAGGAALGFGVAPVHDTVPEALVAACVAHGLPLLEVPPRTTFSGVARAVWQLMAQARLAELRHVTEAQQSLAAAASRPDPVPSVLRQLAGRLGGWAVLYGPEGTEIASAGRQPGEEVRAALARLTAVVRPTRSTPAALTAPRTGSTPPAGATRPAGPGAPAQSGRSATAAPTDSGRPTPASAMDPGRHAPASATETGRPAPASATDTAAGLHLASYALGAGHGFVLGVAAPRRAPGDHTVASVAAVLLSLLTGEQQSGTGAARSSALVRLLLGAPPEEVATLLGDGPWLVVHARPDGDGAPDPVAASALGAALGSALVDPAGDAVRVLVPAGLAPAPLPGWTLGVSAAVAPHDWPTADTQAARALARARATRSPLVRHSARPALADLVPTGEAAAHARAVLAPVTAHPALTETLRTWLSLHGSWDRTAVALSVHRNTVRQRVARCAALLETDLDDPDVRMELWFALRHV